jgi:hypothetical protein
MPQDRLLLADGASYLLLSDGISRLLLSTSTDVEEEDVDIVVSHTAMTKHIDHTRPSHSIAYTSRTAT